MADGATGPLGPVVNFVDTVVRAICAATLWIAFLAMFLPTFANAALRYSTNASLNWSVEAVQLTFPWFIMAGAVLAAQHGRHIGVETIMNLLPKRLALWIALAVQLLILSACLSVAWVYLGLGQFEGGMAFAAGDVAFTSLGVPQSWSYMALLFGYVLLGLTAISSACRLIGAGRIRPGEEIPSPE